jgi:FAT domain
MIHRAYSGTSPWKSLFHCCRTAVRAEVGLTVAEFILPLLLLDRLCFGDLRDKDHIFQEMLDVFNCNEQESPCNIMPQPERRQAVNTVFMVLETWQVWTEAEKEAGAGQPGDLSQSTGNWGTDGTWDADDCIGKIQESLSRLPLQLQANSAASVGMHALALRILEMAARMTVVEKVFNSTSDQMRDHALKCKQGYSMALGDHVVDGSNLKLMKDVLAELNNCETMAALEENNRAEPRERTLDSIRQNEASGNWEEALRDYERVQQLRGGEKSNDSKLQYGALRCLLELGQFESVLNQVIGVGKRPQSALNGMETEAVLAKPFAVEAAWRLGRWDILADIVEKEVPDAMKTELDPEGVYQIAHGRAILGLYKKDITMTAAALDDARKAVMDSLSSVARESYSRSYPFVVRLQCLRELEDAMECICCPAPANTMSFSERASSESRDGWGWQKRLELVSPSSSAPVINTRVALARIARAAVLEGSLFLDVGKKARKTGLFNIAADSLTQAEAVFNGIPRSECGKDLNTLLDATKMQLAKLKHDAGHSSAALKMLGLDQVQQLFGMEGRLARQEILSQKADFVSANETALDDDAIIDRFSRRVLQSTHWIVSGGLKDGGEIINRFRIVQEVAPHLEKGEKGLRLPVFFSFHS